MIDYIHPESKYYRERGVPVRKRYVRDELDDLMKSRPKGYYGAITDVTNIIPIEITGKNIPLERKVYSQQTIDWNIKMFPPDGIPNNLKEHLEIKP